MTLFHFSVLSWHFCVRLSEVRRVFSLVALQPIPGAPPYLQGLMNLEGRGVPVLDLARRLGLERSLRYRVDTPLLLCCTPRFVGALVVDEIYGVMEVDPEAIQGGELFERGLPPVLGAVALDGRMALLLDLGRILELDLSRIDTDLGLDDALLALCGDRP